MPSDGKKIDYIINYLRVDVSLLVRLEVKLVFSFAQARHVDVIKAFKVCGWIWTVWF